MIPHALQISRRKIAPGFTLVELMMVVVILGIVSVSVIPAMSNIRSMREGAARDDLVRYIEVTKGRSAASGSPHGVQVNLSNSSVSIVKINSKGLVEIVVDPLTQANRTLFLADLYPGVSIIQMSNGDGAGGSGTIWFDFKSNPMVFSPMGRTFTINKSSARITLSSGEQIVVYPHSGTLEVQ